MSKYTTGELAKLCGVSVRTVQYYDSRGILIPSALSEGGRRLYSEEDCQRMKIICYLRELGLSIDTIGKLLHEKHPEASIELLLEEQEQILSAELAERQSQLRRLRTLRAQVRSVDHFTVDSIGDIVHLMQNKKKMNQLRWQMLTVGLLMDLLEVGSVLYGICTGNWWPTIPAFLIVIALGVGISYHYFTHVEYICPGCHSIFFPRFKEAFFARHTPKLRRLTCPHCGQKSFCLETYREVKKNGTTD